METIIFQLLSCLYHYDSGMLGTVCIWKQSLYTVFRRLAVIHRAAGIPISGACGNIPCRRYTAFWRRREVCAKSVYRLLASKGLSSMLESSKYPIFSKKLSCNLKYPVFFGRLAGSTGYITFWSLVALLSLSLYLLTHPFTSPLLHWPSFTTRYLIPAKAGWWDNRLLPAVSSIECPCMFSCAHMAVWNLVIQRWQVIIYRSHHKYYYDIES